jgi:ubiquinone/menaquinone biosynthesis C-methylase UbiE
MQLPFGYAQFDITCTHRVLHHLRRPELAVSELARVTRPGGRILVADQLGSVDPLRSMEMDRFERLRDPTHQRLLPDQDIRGYLDANDLVLLSSEIVSQRIDLEQRLELAGFSEEERVRIRGAAPAASYEIEVGWYVARKPGP